MYMVRSPLLRPWTPVTTYGTLKGYINPQTLSFHHKINIHNNNNDSTYLTNVYSDFGSGEIPVMSL